MKFKLSAIALFAAMLAGTPTLPTAQTVIARSVRANYRDWQAEPAYSYFELDRNEGGGSETYHVRMIEGSPYQQLVARDGRPLTPEDQRKEQKKLEDEMARRAAESAQRRAERIANYEKERKRNQLLMAQLSEAFDFKLMGLAVMDGHKTYRLQATPRPGYQPPNRETQVLTGMQGNLWVDTASYQWVRVEAFVTHPVSIEGFLARVDPGTRFELEKMPVGPGVWLPKRFAVKAKAKILFVINHKSHDEEVYFNYRKTQPLSDHSPK